MLLGHRIVHLTSPEGYKYCIQLLLNAGIRTYCYSALTNLPYPLRAGYDPTIREAIKTIKFNLELRRRATNARQHA